MPILTCSHCSKSTEADPREISGRLYYDCPSCKKATRLKRYATATGEIILIPSQTGRPGHGKVLRSYFIDGDLAAELDRRAVGFGDKSLIVNSALRDYLHKVID